MIFVVIGGLLVLFMTYALLEDLYLMKVKKFPPGPLSLPVIGGLHHLNIKAPYLSISSLADKYGSVFSIRMGIRERAVFIEDAELIKQMLNNRMSADRPNLPFFDIISKGADGIGSRPYDATWSLHTKIIHTTLLKLSHNQLDDIMQSTTTLLFKRFDEMKGVPQNVHSGIHEACLFLMATLVFGNKYSSLTDPALQHISWINQQTIKGVNPGNPLNILPIMHLVKAFNRNIQALVESKDSLLNNEYNEHAASFDGEIKNIMDMVVEETLDHPKSDNRKKRNQKIHAQSLLMSVFTLIAAGHNNLSDTLSWIFLYLAKHPDLQQKVSEEIQTNTDSTTSFISLDNSNKLPYTNAFIMEVFRIVSLSHLSIPRMTSQTINIGGYHIPKGTTLFGNLWSIHHSEKHWDNPHEFDPSRFLEANYNQHEKNYFMPFGWGKRKCIGQHLSKQSLLSFVSNLVKNYQLTLPAGAEPDMQGIVNLSISPPSYELILQKRE